MTAVVSTLDTWILTTSIVTNTLAWASLFGLVGWCAWRLLSR